MKHFQKVLRGWWCCPWSSHLWLQKRFSLHLEVAVPRPRADMMTYLVCYNVIYLSDRLWGCDRVQQNAISNIYSMWSGVFFYPILQKCAHSMVFNHWKGEGKQGSPAGDTVPCLNAVHLCGGYSWLGTTWEELALRPNRRDSPEKCAVPLL